MDVVNGFMVEVEGEDKLVKLFLIQCRDLSSMHSLLFISLVVALCLCKDGKTLTDY